MAEQIHILCDLELKQVATEQARTDGIPAGQALVNM